MIALCFQPSVIMADFFMYETQHPIIVIILIKYSLYFSEALIELYKYIVPKTAISSSFYVKLLYK